MKKWTAIYLLFFPLVIFAQVDIVNTGLIDPTLNILYIGVENDIEVLGLDNDTTLTLTSINGKVFQWKPSSKEFQVKVNHIGIDTLQLYKSDSLILSRVFMVKKFNEPIPQLGNLSDTATVQEIMDNQRLQVVIPDCFYNLRYRVSYFEILLFKASGDMFKAFDKTYSNQLTKGQIKTIKRLSAGDKIVFGKITITGPDCINRRLKPLVITIE